MFSTISLDQLNQSENDQFVITLIRYIKDKGLQPGDQLPSIRTMADEMHLTQSQIRSGFLRAEALGFISIQPRSGCYVKGIGLEKLTLLFGLFFTASYTGKTPLLDLYEVKTALEDGIVKKVVEIRTDSELYGLREIIEKQEKATSLEEMVSLDEAFHNYLAKMSRVELYEYLVSIIQSLLREPRMHFDDYVESFPTIIKDHWAIYEAIKNKDGEKAYESMDIHSNRRRVKLLKNC